MIKYGKFYARLFLVRLRDFMSLQRKDTLLIKLSKLVNVRMKRSFRKTAY